MAGAETILTFALGFLIASLVALMLAAPLWRRAEKVTRKRLESSLPVSSEDIAADKDKLRADFALSTRKLELNLEKLRKKAQEQMSSVQDRNRKLQDMESELKTRSATESDQEAELRETAQKLAITESELKRRTRQMEEMREKLNEFQSVLDRQSHAIKEASSLAEGHRDEIDTLKGDNAEKSSEIEKQAKSIVARDTKLSECGEKVAAANLLVAKQKSELKEKAALVAKLEDEAKTRESTLAVSLREAQERIAELEANEADLARANDEIAELKARITAVNEEYNSRIVADGRENAMLRQRIGDLAADVQRMTDALDYEDTDLPPVASLAPALKLRNGGARDAISKSLSSRANADKSSDIIPINGEIAMAGKSSSLADRIRSLQRDITG